MAKSACLQAKNGIITYQWGWGFKQGFCFVLLVYFCYAQTQICSILAVKMLTWLSLSAWKSARLFVQDWRLWWTDTSNVLAPLSILRAGKASSGLEKFLNSSTSFWASSSHIFSCPGQLRAWRITFLDTCPSGKWALKFTCPGRKSTCIVLYFILFLLHPI